MQSQAILILNQEEAVRNSLQVVLTDEGYRCFTSADEEHTLQLIEKENIALVILDNYWAVDKDLLKQLTSYHPTIKYVVITSYASLEICQLTLRKEIDELILKPLDFDELLLLIEKLNPSLSRSYDS